MAQQAALRTRLSHGLHALHCADLSYLQKLQLARSHCASSLQADDTEQRHHTQAASCRQWLKAILEMPWCNNTTLCIVCQMPDSSQSCFPDSRQFALLFHQASHIMVQSFCSHLVKIGMQRFWQTGKGLDWRMPQCCQQTPRSQCPPGLLQLACQP